MRIRVRPNKVMVFAVRGKRLFNGLITPQVGNYSDYYQLQKVWVAELGEGCTVVHDGIHAGSEACVLDVYELETLPKNVFQEYYARDPERFQGVIDEAEKYDGLITTEVVHENSLIGEVVG